MEIDAVGFEMFLHRLWAIGEEGRTTLQRVTASPIVAQGGECMSSFYDPTGTMVLACSGHLRFAAANSDAIKSLIQWFRHSPGFHEGDQFFFNDPYVAGSHTYDMMVIMPIFHQGNLIAWIATSTHTADTGGLLRGGATEIYHEGIRILGLKVVERGEFRKDVFTTLTEQCRDPEYVGLDLKAMIAGNNVCASRYLGLVKKFGLEFVKGAAEKVIRDSEQMARSKLRSLPDGIWTARQYVTTLDRKSRRAIPQQIMCTMTKEGENLHMDFTGTSSQTDTDHNSTLPSTTAHIALALTNTLFWDLPWSDGKLRPVKIDVPEGSILNCRYPAACGSAPRVGNVLVSTVCECVAKMIYASGRDEDVFASTPGNVVFAGGPGFFYGGHNREGIPVAQGMYDQHGSGLGATPQRDGVNTGGHLNIPSAGITDVERIEMQYPFLYFTRAHNQDGSGFGRFRGGLGSMRIFLIYGSEDCSTDYKPYGGVAQGGFGLFGGYPTGTGALRVMVKGSPDLLERVRQGEMPTDREAIQRGDWGDVLHPQEVPERVPLPGGTLVTDYVAGGGGFGDPLDREPEAVLRDYCRKEVSRGTAEAIYGVILDREGVQVDLLATQAARERLRALRRAQGSPLAGETSSDLKGASKVQQPVLRFHEVLEIATDGQNYVIRCRRCGHLYCATEENYKLYALCRVVDLNEYMPYPLPSGERYEAQYQEYYCPRCVTRLQVDVYCPSVGGDPVLWDTRIHLDRLPR
ncbi:MAG: hydantoinase B/oxoprolinase family protein [Candidatus Binatia bacterium]